MSQEVWYFYIWCDGQVIGVEGDIGGSLDSGQSIWIGGPAHDRYFEGVIDDIRIYRHALTDQEAIALYEESNPLHVIDDVPIRSEIETCYPNPFNPNMIVSLSVVPAQHVSISIFDMTGRRIAVVADQAFSAGSHTVQWNGRDSSGRLVSSGTYLVRMETDTGLEMRKVMLVR